MIKFFHKYNSSVVMFFIALVVCLTMLGFGVDVFRDQQRDHAIKVNEHSISHGDFYNRKQMVLDRYRSMFGENFAAVEEALKADLNENLVESVISEQLQQDLASKIGFTRSPRQVEEIIRNQMFSGSFDPEAYKDFLRRMGKSSREFEKELGAETVREQLVGLISDFAQASNAEAQTGLEREKTKFNLSYIELKPEAVLSQVKEPSTDELNDWFERNASKYETPAKVAYSLAVLDPEIMQQIVPVNNEDLELFYTDNLDRFTEPEENKVSLIKISRKEDQPEGGKTRALEALEKAKAGENFKALVKTYSDDMTTTIVDGDLGWVKKGARGREFDRALANLRQGDVTDLIERDGAWEIYKLVEKKPSKTKDFASVKSEIEQEIRKREAPAFVMERAHELFDKWQKQGTALVEFANAEKLSNTNSNGLRKSNEDPGLNMVGLTSKVLDSASNKRQLVELGNKAILVEITEFQEQKIPAFQEVKDQIKADLVKGRANELARAKMNTILGDLRNKKFATLEDAAKANSLAVKAETELTQNGGKKPNFLADPRVSDSVFSVSVENEAPKSVIEHAGNFYLAAVTKIIKPEIDAKDLNAQYMARASASIASDAVETMTKKLKAEAQIDVSPSLMSDS